MNFRNVLKEVPDELVDCNLWRGLKSLMLKDTVELSDWGLLSYCLKLLLPVLHKVIGMNLRGKLMPTLVL